MTVLIASTCRHFKTTGPQGGPPSYLGWVTWAEDWAREKCRFFLAAQRDGFPSDGLDGLADLVRSVGGVVWDFSIDEHNDRIDSASRLLGITTGRNLAHEYAQRDPDITHILFLDTDVTPPRNAVTDLLEVVTEFMGLHLVGGHIPLYGLTGPRQPGSPDAWDLQQHWSSAGFLLVDRDAFRVLRWRYDLEEGMTDDPCFAADAKRMGFGYTLVRHSVVGQHYPARMLVPVEKRGHNLSLRPDDHIAQP